MLTRKEIKDIQSLTQKKSRDALNLFVAEGSKSVQELVNSRPDIIHHVYGIEEEPLFIDTSIPYTRITEIELDRLSQLRTPGNILAVAHKMSWQQPRAGKVVYVDGIQDPGNLGTIIRTADWFALDAVVCSADTVDVYNSKVIQATMGSVFRMPVYYDMELDWLRKQSENIFIATMQGQSYNLIGKLTTGILVIGNEGRGVSQHILDLSDQHITIPRIGSAESLNASVAAGILMERLFG